MCDNDFKIQKLISFYPKIIKKAKYFTKKDDVEDLVQDTYLTLLPKIDNIAYINDEKLRKFVYVVLRNTYISSLRKNKMPKASLTEEIESPFNSENDYNLEELIRVINSIQLKHKEVIKLYLIGYLQREIAKELNLSIGTVNSTIKTIKKRIEIYDM